MAENVGEQADPPQPAAAGDSSSNKPLAVLGLAALGIVFGDIGTSPLYTVKTVLGLTNGNIGGPTTLGVLSLLAWTLVMVTSIRYVSFAMRIDNDGEGGILALCRASASSAATPRRL